MELNKYYCCENNNKPILQTCAFSLLYLCVFIFSVLKEFFLLYLFCCVRTIPMGDIVLVCYLKLCYTKSYLCL